VARVVEIKGEVSAISRADKNTKERPLSLGKAVYNADTISSEKDSYALLVFLMVKKSPYKPTVSWILNNTTIRLRAKKTKF